MKPISEEYTEDYLIHPQELYNIGASQADMLIASKMNIFSMQMQLMVEEKLQEMAGNVIKHFLDGAIKQVLDAIKEEQEEFNEQYI